MTDSSDALTLAPLSPSADADVWAAARADYESGCSAPVVAERHGLNQRTVRRRAAAEGWRRPARDAAEAEGLAEMYARVAAGLARPDVEREQALAADPRLEEMVSGHTFEVGRLLMEPTPERLSRFAFRRAAEFAAKGAAAEAAAWLRLCAGVERMHSVLIRASQPCSPAEHYRAYLAAQLETLEQNGALFSDLEEADEADEAAVSDVRLSAA